MSTPVDLFGESRGGAGDDATRGRSAGTPTNPQRDATRPRA